MDTGNIPEAKNPIIEKWKKINDHKRIDWSFRILFSLTFVTTALVLQEEHYPDVCWLMLFISIWCYFFKAVVIGFLPLLLAMFIHFVHFQMF